MATARRPGRVVAAVAGAVGPRTMSRRNSSWASGPPEGSHRGGVRVLDADPIAVGHGRRDSAPPHAGRSRLARPSSDAWRGSYACEAWAPSPARYGPDDVHHPGDRWRGPLGRGALRPP